MRTMLLIGVLAMLPLGSCTREEPAGDKKSSTEMSGEPAKGPSNRVDIPGPVRSNLGITFATVETRAVAQTLRVPGRFELLPTARREARAPLGGRVELLVEPNQRVETGAVLYRLDSSGWRDLHERIAASKARLDSMTPLRAAHRVHEETLGSKVGLWQERLTQLESIRAAGGGSADKFIEARATMAATQAELADVMEKDAELEATEKSLASELRSLEGRREQVERAAGGGGQPAPGVLEVRAAAPGVVESIAVSTGGLAEESGLVLTLVQPEKVRFTARAPQAELGRLREGLEARVVPPAGGSIDPQAALSAELRLGLTADPDLRTIELFVEPKTLGSWARAGVAAHLEVTLAGASAELAVPSACIVRDGATPIFFRRDPADPDKVIRMTADVGMTDGRWTVIQSGIREGDQIVLAGNYALMLATSGAALKGGHFHSDGTWHEDH